MDGKDIVIHTSNNTDILSLLQCNYFAFTGTADEVEDLCEEAEDWNYTVFRHYDNEKSAYVFFLTEDGLQDVLFITNELPSDDYTPIRYRHAEEAVQNGSVLTEES